MKEGACQERMGKEGAKEKYRSALGVKGKGRSVKKKEERDWKLRRNSKNAPSKEAL
jgi:hypothetical protein